jgi:long-chain acyl-CoA synthetase
MNVRLNQSFIGSNLAQFTKEQPQDPLIFYANEWTSRGRFFDEVGKRIMYLSAEMPPKPKVALDLSSPLDLLFWFFSVCISGGEAHVLAPEWPSKIKADAIEKSGAHIVIDDEKNSQLMLRPSFSSSFELTQFLANVTPESTFYVGYTSGSTSFPKAYRRTHRSWLKSFEAETNEFAINSSDVIVAFSPLSHSLGLYAAVRAIHLGSKLVLFSKFDPKRALHIMKFTQPNVCYAAPSHLKLIESLNAEEIVSVRLVLSSGAKWYGSERRLLKIFPRAEFAEFYGTSELSFVSVRRQSDEAPLHSVGRPFPGVRVTVQNENGAVLPPGEKGRLFVESPFLFEGYLGEGSTLYKSGCMISVGDIGWIDENGFIFLEGRENRMIVTAGKNVFPEALEACLLEHPSVEHALVLGIRDEVRGAILVAFILPKLGHAPKAQELKSHLAKTTPRAVIPKYFVQPFQWRSTRSGKVDADALFKDFHEKQFRYL